MLRIWLLACLTCSWAASQGLAQLQPAGTVHGQVLDSERNPLQDVEVQLISLSDGKPIIAHTDIAGRFAFTGLPAGRYSLAFHLDRYASRRVGPREVLREAPVEVSVQLNRLSAPLTRPRAGMDSIALEYGLVREQIESVPVLLGAEGRTSTDKLLLLVPGLTPADSLEVDPFSGRGAPVSANGSRRSAINYQLDGASNNVQNRLTGAQAATFGPAPEAIETFRVVTHTYSARDGRNAGAVVSPLTRSGGSTWHGQLRGFLRPDQGDSIESFDGSIDSMKGWAAGGSVGGPVSLKHGLFLFADVEGWRTNRQHLGVLPVLTLAERAGDFSGAPARNLPTNPDTGQPYPNGLLPAEAIDPLMQRYLDAFVPLPNAGPALHRSQSGLDSRGEMLLGRVDKRWREWSLNLSHFTFRNEVDDPLSRQTLELAPGAVSRRRQLSHNAQISFTHSPSARLSHTTRLAMQRLSISRWQGHPGSLGVSAEEFGFDFERFGANPGTLPDVTLLDNNGAPRMQIAPFLFAESSAQTAFQAGSDFVFRGGGQAFRGGVLVQRGIWPFTNTENFAGSFDFSVDAFRGTRNSVANLLMGVPSVYRLRTPRSLNLRWHELAVYGEAELQPVRGLHLTLGLRYESQPPAVDRLDRIAAFREKVETQRFPDTLPNLIFPGDPDPGFGPLPRSTVRSKGRNLAPRVGLSFSPSSDSRLSRWVLGESGRSVFRASYGVFYDFGAFAGSSAAALFQATFPPFSIDNRYQFARLGQAGSFRSPLSTVARPGGGGLINPNAVSYPILVFDPLFENAAAHHWNIGWQRLLPQRLFLSVVYVGTRSLRLQRQRELNVFSRNPLLGFSQIQNQRRYQIYRDIRSFESTGSGRYNGMQLRLTRYLSGGLAFDGGYTWAKSADNGSSIFGDALATEPWALSSFDRRHTFTASWFYQVRLPASVSDRLRWADRWQVSGTWRLRTGLPLDIRQTQDPTFSFVRVGRPDLVGEFRRLDPAEVRTFTLADGRTVSGRFAFDPSAVARVEPKDFDQVRPGTAPRNAFRMHGYQQWDVRIARPVAVSESMSVDFGVDLINLLNDRNWDAPFSNIDHPYFGIVQSRGLGRTFQASLRLTF